MRKNNPEEEIQLIEKGITFLWAKLWWETGNELESGVH